MTNYAQYLNPNTKPVTEKLKSNQVLNNTGGYTFALAPEKQFERFLILGAPGGSYYCTEREMTIDNAKCVVACLDKLGAKAVDTIVQISDSGRAPKNDPAILALAIASSHSNDEVRKAAFSALPKVCRTGTMLFQFVEARKQLGAGWGSGMKRAVSKWYEEKNEKQLMYQLTKYQQRNGVSNRDLFRLAHPENVNPAIAQWVIGIENDMIGQPREIKGHSKSGIRDRVYSDHTYILPEYLERFDELKTADEKRTIELIEKFGFTHEMINTQHKNSAKVWEALLPNMPLTALIRNLGKMSQVGLLAPLSDASKTVCEKLKNAEHIKKSRLHPVSILSALRTYSQGHGDKGSLTWNVVPTVVDALNDAFYVGFDVLEPTGKSHMLAIDVSGSMDSKIMNLNISCREMAGCLAMATARKESNYWFFGFCHRFVPLKISANMRLDSVLKEIYKADFGSTDCSQPFVYANANNLNVEVFHVYTDSEVNCGTHPAQAMKMYRQKSGINAKLAVVGMTATNFTIADPADKDSIDVVGCDTSVPAVLADFARN